MPDPIVELYVKNQKPNRGWQNCEDGQGNAVKGYCYYFTGGNAPEDGPGYFKGKKGDAAMTVVIKLQSDGFRIKRIDFKPPNGDCSENGSAPKVRNIVDKNDHNGNEPEGKGEYIVVVEEDVATPTQELHCHPGWKND